MAGRVAWISVAPVKGLALHHPEEVRLKLSGASGNRRFFLVDAQGRLLNGKRLGRLVRVHASFDEGANALELRFPDGSEVRGGVALGEPVVTSFYGRSVPGRFAPGPWDAALTAWSSLPVRLVQPDRHGEATDRGREGGVSLVSAAGLDALAGEAGAEVVDARRFRMLFGVDGIEAHEEDGWLSRPVQIGGATVEFRGNVGRCAITSQNPDTGTPDLDTLRALARYRGDVETTEPLPLGVWGEVIEPGAVRLGDAVNLV